MDTHPANLCWNTRFGRRLFLVKAAMFGGILMTKHSKAANKNVT